MIPLIEPTTERLLLRQWRDDDFDAFAKLSSDPVAMEFFPKCLDREESDIQAAKYRQRIINQGWGFWAVELRGVASFIGFVGLNRPDASLPISPCVEIGWRMLPEYWGKGYATEAARASLRVGFEQLDLDEIVSFTATINLRSQRVMQRLGMEHDGEKFDHPWLEDDSPLKEHVVYRLSRECWSRNEGT